MHGQRADKGGPCFGRASCRQDKPQTQKGVRLGVGLLEPGGGHDGGPQDEGPAAAAAAAAARAVGLRGLRGRGRVRDLGRGAPVPAGQWAGAAQVRGRRGRGRPRPGAAGAPAGPGRLEPEAAAARDALRAALAARRRAAAAGPAGRVRAQQGPGRVGLGARLVRHDGQLPQPGAAAAAQEARQVGHRMC